MEPAADPGLEAAIDRMLNLVPPAHAAMPAGEAKPSEDAEIEDLTVRYLGPNLAALGAATTCAEIMLRLIGSLEERAYEHFYADDPRVDPEIDEGSDPAVRSKASVRCENCGHTWRDRGRGFWARVTKYRCFPTACFLCGADLPVWEVEPPEAQLSWHCVDPF